MPKTAGHWQDKIDKGPNEQIQFFEESPFAKNILPLYLLKNFTIFCCSAQPHPPRPPHRKKAALPSLTYHQIVIFLTPHLYTVSRPISLRFGCSLQKYQATFHLWVGGKKYRRSRRRNRRQPKGSAGYFKKVWSLVMILMELVLAVMVILIAQLVGIKVFARSL